MLNRDVFSQEIPQGPSKYSSLLRILGVSVFVSVFAIGVGIWVGGTLLSNEEGKTSSEIQKEIDDLRTAISAMESINLTLTEKLNQKEDLDIGGNKPKTQTSDVYNSSIGTETDFAQYQNQIDALKSEVQSLKVDSSGLSDKQDTLRTMANSIEKHRLLLLELRKDLPITRQGSAGYWYNMKNVAVKADPSLGSSVNRVILKIDNYFDWNDKTPQNDSSSQDFMKWQADYASSGAIEYEQATIAFTKDALRSVITKLESIVMTVQ